MIVLAADHLDYCIADLMCPGLLACGFFENSNTMIARCVCRVSFGGRKVRKPSRTLTMSYMERLSMVPGNHA